MSTSLRALNFAGVRRAEHGIGILNHEGFSPVIPE